MIRVRRLPKRRFGRPKYEVEYCPVTESDGWTTITAYPVFDIEKIVGTGDAWALIKAADTAWDGSQGDWAIIYAPGERPEDTP